MQVVSAVRGLGVQNPDVGWCCSSSLQELPEDLGLPSLRELNLASCLLLRRLPEQALAFLTSLSLLNLSR